MPVAQSPSYHGYDVTNYYQVNRDYGSNEDFRRLMAEAHGQGIRVVVDLVLNHMSSEHPYFKSALLDPESPRRDWFLWSPTERKSKGWSVATWHKAPDRNEYYYGLFWQGMPDLNLANPVPAGRRRALLRKRR
jgi:glycosidase